MTTSSAPYSSTRGAGAIVLMFALSACFPDFSGLSTSTSNAIAEGSEAGGSERVDAGAAGADDAGDEPVVAERDAFVDAEAQCAPPAVTHPDGCYDHARTGKETDVDCGGGECQACADGSCMVDSDCLASACTAGKCSARFEVQYQALESQALAPRINFRVSLRYASGSGAVDTRSLSMRYYFRRDGVAEPITVTNAAATLTQTTAGSEISADTSWDIVRTADGTSGDFDAYLEIHVTKSHSMLPGDFVTTDQAVNPGNASRTFDQRSHYSFDAGQAMINSDRITAYQDGRLIWGYEPRGAGQTSCFSQGVNFNGSALLIGADNWAGQSTSLQSSGSAFSQASLLYPNATGPLVMMIQSGYRLTAGDDIRFPVRSGDYLAYVYAFSDNGSELGTLNIQGVDVDDFQGGTFNGAQLWGKQ